MAGDGTGYVLLPGYGLGPSTYRRTARLLAEAGARVIVPRWIAASPWTYHGTIAALRATLDDEGLDRTVLVGHSFGGAVALGFAATHPERVSRCVFVDSNALDAHWELAREALPGLLRAYRMASMDAGLDFFRSWAAHPEGMVRAAWWGFNCRMDDEIAAVRAAGLPCDVFWAERDTLVSKDLGARFARDLGAQLFIVTDPGGAGPVDHGWIFQHPELFVARLEQRGLLPEQIDP